MNSEVIEIKELNHADRDASVKLVSIDGVKYILKTDDLMLKLLVELLSLR